MPRKTVSYQRLGSIRPSESYFLEFFLRLAVRTRVFRCSLGAGGGQESGIRSPTRAVRTGTGDTQAVRAVHLIQVCGAGSRMLRVISAVDPAKRPVFVSLLVL